MSDIKIIGANNKGEDYTHKQVNIDPVQMKDEADGNARIVREFIFSFNPETVKKIKEKKMGTISRQELFNSHAKQIEIMLWGDGLVFDTNYDPRMIIGKKKYKIVVVCKVRQGVLLGRGNKLNTITEALQKNA